MSSRPRIWQMLLLLRASHEGCIPTRLPPRPPICPLKFFGERFKDTNKHKTCLRSPHVPISYKGPSCSLAASCGSFLAFRHQGFRTAVRTGSPVASFPSALGAPRVAGTVSQARPSWCSRPGRQGSGVREGWRAPSALVVRAPLSQTPACCAELRAARQGLPQSDGTPAISQAPRTPHSAAQASRLPCFPSPGNGHPSPGPTQKPAGAPRRAADPRGVVWERSLGQTHVTSDARPSGPQSHFS